MKATDPEHVTNPRLVLPQAIAVTSLSQVVLPVVTAGGTVAFCFLVVGMLAAFFGAALEFFGRNARPTAGAGEAFPVVGVNSAVPRTHEDAEAAMPEFQQVLGRQFATSNGIAGDLVDARHALAGADHDERHGPDGDPFQQGIGDGADQQHAVDAVVAEHGGQVILFQFC